VELYLHFPTRGRGAMCNEVRYVFRAWCLVKHRENFTFTFYLKKNSVAVNEDKITLSYSMMGEMGYP